MGHLLPREHARRGGEAFHPLCAWPETGLAAAHAKIARTHPPMRVTARSSRKTGRPHDFKITPWAPAPSSVNKSRSETLTHFAEGPDFYGFGV